MATRQGAITSKTKKIKPNVKINILDKSYALHDENISWINKRL
jgi:hypothetical protein